MSGEPQVPEAPAAGQREVRQWAMFLHLSLLAGYLVPLAGWVAPIVIWQLKKAEMPELDVHGKIVVNWLISFVIYFIASFLLTCVLIGFPMVVALVIVNVVFPIVGGIKASNGEVWPYPLSIRFLK
jgi:uncharacterized Tic20 family protein